MKKEIKNKVNKITKNITKFLKKYASTNILFLSYVILSVLVGFSLRWATIGNKYIFKPIFCDIAVALLIGAFGYLFKPKYQFRYFFSWLFFAVALAIANTIYYQFFKSFISVNLISTASMIGEVNDSLFEKMHFYQFLYLIYLFIFIFIHKKLSKKNYYFEVEKIEKGKRMFTYTLASSGIIVLLLSITLTGTDLSRLIKQWNRDYVVQKFGLYVYTINDMVQSMQPKIDTLFGYDESAKTFREYYSCRWANENKKKNEYTDIFKGRNVVFIHMESMQNFLLDLELNGEKVTPNINKLASEGIYFSRFYPQISTGTSSDTEFTLLTGLMPSASGTVFVNYYDRDYKSMPKYFDDLGYYTFSMHANNAEYWNRKAMHNSLGYKKFYAKDSYEVPTDTKDPNYVGLGLSDKSFFKQILPILNDINDTKSPYFGTIITLSNHSPFNAVSKYDPFDVTMKYTEVNENGEEEEKTAKYIDGTPMGNYVKSAHYADAALGQFFEDVENGSFADDTVFILYGDHEARLAKSQFDLLYNYDPKTDERILEDDENYYSLDNYKYDLLKNTPLIIWTKDKKFQKEITDVMGMYDILPTVANMFGFEEKYALGHDIFSDNEKIVVFPNGNVLTNKVYYSNLNNNYVVLTDETIDEDYITRISSNAEKILDVSNGIIRHDLIKKEADKIGECNSEKK